jgi:hypothetical protein
MWNHYSLISFHISTYDIFAPKLNSFVLIYSQRELQLVLITFNGGRTMLICFQLELCARKISSVQPSSGVAETLLINKKFSTRLYLMLRFNCDNMNTVKMLIKNMLYLEYQYWSKIISVPIKKYHKISIKGYKCVIEPSSSLSLRETFDSYEHLQNTYNNHKSEN